MTSPGHLEDAADRLSFGWESDGPREGRPPEMIPRDKGPLSTQGRLPDFLIIGAMRSGTTSLAHYLGAHPEVFMATEKEVHFFDRELSRGLGWYRSHFLTDGDVKVGEATQTYMFESEVPRRIATTVPEVRLIAILRDPVDRAYSHYLMNRAAGGERLLFADAIEQEPIRLTSCDSIDYRKYSYVERGMYLKQLLRVCRWIPRRQLYVLLFDDLRDHPSEAYRSLCEWLGLSAFTPANLGEATNAQVRFRSRRLRKVSKRLPSSGRRIVGALNTYKARHEPMDPKTRRELKRRFETPNDELAAWLARDLSMWNHVDNRD